MAPIAIHLLLFELLLSSSLTESEPFLREVTFIMISSLDCSRTFCCLIATLMVTGALYDEYLQWQARTPSRQRLISKRDFSRPWRILNDDDDEDDDELLINDAGTVIQDVQTQSKQSGYFFLFLLRDTSVTTGIRNPHSAEQKHQSLSSVLLSARPRHPEKAEHHVTNTTNKRY